MNKLIYSIALNFSLLLFSTLLLTACGGGGSDPVNNVNPPGNGSAEISSAGGTVTTFDEKASLIFPAGAIANPTTITIERVDQATVNALFEGVATPAVVYKLGPDGLDFGVTPVTFSITLDDATVVDANGNIISNAVVAIHVADDGTVSAIDNLETKYDGATGITTVSGEITHFSELEFDFINLFNIAAEDIPDTLEVAATFDATISVLTNLGLKRPETDLILANQDNSIFPLQQTINNEFRSNPADDEWFDTDTYTCTIAGSGLYLTTVSWSHPLGEDGFWEITDPKDPTRTQPIPVKYAAKSHTFSKLVGCVPPPVQVSIRLGSSSSLGEFGVYEVFMELSGELPGTFTEGITLALDYTGTATEGEDWQWVSSTPVFHFKPGGGLTVTAEYRVFDDTVSEGDEIISWEASLQPMIEGDGVIIDAPTLSFDLIDDPIEPVLQSAELIFTMTPQVVESVIGQSFTVTATEEVKVGAGTRSVEALMVPRDSGIIGAPVLLAFQGGDGSLSAHISGDTLSVGLLLEGSTNTQRFSFPCIGVGTTFIDITFKDTTPDPVTVLAKDFIEVTCFPTSPLDVFISEFVSINGPESFLRLLGKAFLELSMYTGRPFPNPPANTMNDPGLGLAASQNVAVVAGDEGIATYDLEKGTEITRLSIVLGIPYGGGVVIKTPDLPWLAMYSSTGFGAIRHTYNSEFEVWGIGLLTNSGENVTDMTSGPVDANGHQLAYAVVSHSANRITWNEYDVTVKNWLGPTILQRRRQGGWVDVLLASRGNIVSLAGGFDTPALALIEHGPSTPGTIWLFDPYDVNQSDVTDNRNDTLVGTVGNDPRRIRCMIGICVVTNFGSNSITTLTWSGDGSPATIVATEAVGTGPVGVELIPDGAGGVYALTTGTGSNDYTVTQIGSNGMVQNKITTPLTNCAGPGFGGFSGDGKQVIISCKANSKIVTDTL